MAAITALANQLLVHHYEPKNSSNYQVQINGITALVQSISSNQFTNSPPERDVLRLRERLYLLDSDQAEKIDKVLRRIAQPELNLDSTTYKAIHQKGWKDHWSEYEQFVQLFYPRDQTAQFLTSINELLLGHDGDLRSCLKNILTAVSKYDRKELFECLSSHLFSEEVPVIEKITVLQAIEKMDEKQKLRLSADKLSAFLSEAARKRKIEEIEEQIQEEEKKIKLDEGEKPVASFSMQYEPMKRIHNFDEDVAKLVITSVVHSLKQDPLMSKVLTAWHVAEQQKQDRSQLSLEDILLVEVNRGNCYGQSMKVLELVGSHDSSIITESWLYQNMGLEDTVRYQILHLLQLFLRLHSGAYVFGVPKQLAQEKIEQCFPHHKKRGIRSESIKLGGLEKDVCIGRLSDFIKNDIRNNNIENKQQDCAIQVTLFHTDKPIGHAAIIYYSATQDRYFWYDPLQSRGGLFATNQYKSFLNGVADQLLGYKEDERLNQFFLTAYHL
ncbi:MAG: hypothetical protein JSR46_04785 [Verrucomicrobia bacterium]|nr:hypothetical protein [Verrucomicrobiota bacterium]